MLRSSGSSSTFAVAVRDDIIRKNPTDGVMAEIKKSKLWDRGGRHALTEEQEFRDIYGMDVIEIPTNKPVIRKDLDDAVYMTKKEKYKAVRLI